MHLDVHNNQKLTSKIVIQIVIIWNNRFPIWAVTFYLNIITYTCTVEDFKASFHRIQWISTKNYSCKMTFAFPWEMFQTMIDIYKILHKDHSKHIHITPGDHESRCLPSGSHLNMHTCTSFVSFARLTSFQRHDHKRVWCLFCMARLLELR